MAAPVRTSDDLLELLSSSGWFTRLLDAVQDVDPPEWWIGAGAVRDLAWDTWYGHGFDPAGVKDVDVAYFDPTDLSRARDEQVDAELTARLPDVGWDAKNQAAVHLWYPDRFGFEVPPLRSVEEAVATWPETATAVAVRRGADGELQVMAPHGLDDLLAGVWRRNPVRVSEEEAARRLAAKDVVTRWPGLRVLG